MKLFNIDYILYDLGLLDICEVNKEIGYIYSNLHFSQAINYFGDELDKVTPDRIKSCFLRISSNYSDDYMNYYFELYPDIIEEILNDVFKTCINYHPNSFILKLIGFGAEVNLSNLINVKPLTVYNVDDLLKSYHVIEIIFLKKMILIVIQLDMI